MGAPRASGSSEEIFADPKDACSQAFCTTVVTGLLVTVQD